MKTIFALTTGSYRAGVAVIRTSGDESVSIYKKLTRQEKEPKSRYAEFATFYNPETEEVLDKGLAIYFKAPNSFTGEEVVEYHIHGGYAVINDFLKVLSEFENCRLAEPGEFTKRAFVNGKMDLTAAEAIADLVDAETEAQKMQALEQLGGGLAKLYNGWAESLKKALAYQEAEIEFPDDDMPNSLSEKLKPKILELIDEIENHLDDKRRGERLRNGISIAIIGAPNAGKSSLLNILARRDAAIVSDEAGTTRDVIEVHMDLGGFPVILSDTAGLRETENKIEAEGIKRAKKVSDDADIKIALFDSTKSKFDIETEKLIDKKTIVVLTKIDKGVQIEYDDAFRISSATGSGIDILLEEITRRIKMSFGKKTGPSLTRERHRAALQETLECLMRSVNAQLPELAAEDLRLAMRSLGTITGIVHVEDLLDKIFKDFCIGK